MPKRAITPVEEYLTALPADRRAVVSAVRDVVRGAMPAGYEEGVSYRSIGWVVPLARYPDTYNKQPLSYVALAAQKSHYALYLMCAYQDPAALAWLQAEFVKAGKRLDMGKSCVRFKRLEDLPLAAIGKFVARMPVNRFIALYETARGGR